jgi:hypothetical protein
MTVKIIAEGAVITMKHEELTKNLKLMAEWDYAKNEDLCPDDFTVVSRRFVWWKCASGHSWQAKISDRVSGAGCPYDCCKRRVDFKSLASVRPDLVAEWDYKANDSLSPEDVSACSHIKVQWRCNKGHSFSATVSSRNQGRGCLICLKERLENGR